MSLAQVIVAEKLYNRDFLCEQTDMPLLVRDDTHRFLREKDLKQGGSDERFYVFDQTTKTPKEPPMTSLNLAGLAPSLEGTFEVRDAARQGQGPPGIRDSEGEAAQGLFARAGGASHWHQSGLNPRPGARYRQSKDRRQRYQQQLGQVLPRQPDGEVADSGPRAMRTHRQEGRRFSAFPFLCNDGFDRFVSTPAPGISRRDLHGQDAREGSQSEACTALRTRWSLMSSRAKV